MAKKPYSYYDPEWKPGHSKQDALSLAVFSQLAYEKKWSDAKKILQEWQFTHMDKSDIKKGWDIDTSATIAVNDDVLVVAMRGSHSLANWATNIQIAKDPGPFRDTNVHQGFQDALYPALLDIAIKAKDMRDKGQQVWITGHSLGGALAVLLTAMLLERGIEVSGLYTFAAPRVGNHKFQRQFDDNMDGKPNYRYVNEHDIVPQLPPEPLFTHTGMRRVITSKKKVTSSSRTWVRIKKTFIGWYNELTDGDIQLKEYHSLMGKDGYIAALAQAAGK